MESIIIKSGGSIKIKGDTTIYTADSFNVSANANVEELLKKLPGIQVDKNGEIKAMGEKVEKVLVDGEEFFGDDPGMAVKNIRADAVKEVQVFDKKSDQAEFTGIDDGNTKKTINLKLKDDRKKGYFGKISTSGGTGNGISKRFNNNLMLGSFKGKRKLSVFVLNGNTGQDGLSWQEKEKYGGNEDMNFDMMDEDGIFSFQIPNGSGDDEISINTQNGFIRNINSGIQYSNKWKDKHNINFSPKYNLQDYANQKTLSNVTQFGDSALYRNDTINTNVYRYNIKNSVIYDLKLDNNNSAKLTLKANYYNTNSTEDTKSGTKGSSNLRKNYSDRTNRIATEKTAVSGTLLVKHKFKKNKRTLSLNTDFNTIHSNSDNFINSSNFTLSTLDTIHIDQLSRSDKFSQKISSKLIFTEPLNKKWAMEMSYELSVNNGNNNQNTAEKSSLGYTDKIDTLSNSFDQTIITQTPFAKLNYSYKKYKFNAGTGVGITSFDLLNKTTLIDYRRNYTNIFPNATFVYLYKSNHSLRIKYNGYQTQPTINQLQPLINNNDLFNRYEGNPNLKPSFANNINLTHNGYNFLKNVWNFQSLNVTFNQNAITNKREINPSSGITTSTPINTNGNYNISLWAGSGFKLKKSEINMQLNTNANISRFADVINNNISYATTYSGGFSMTAEKSKKDKYDISINDDLNYNYNVNSQTSTSNRFMNNTLSLNCTIYYKKVWSVVSDYNYFQSQRISVFNPAISNQIWNAQLQRTFRKNEFILFVKVRDILNQNIGIDRNYYGNTFIEEQNQRLKRYLMIGFTWDFKNKSISSK